MVLVAGLIALQSHVDAAYVGGAAGMYVSYLLS